MWIFKLCRSLPRIQDGVCDAAQSPAATVQLKETNLDEDEKKDINTKKVNTLHIFICYNQA